jgi:large subunit ribosomal protein L3
MSIGILGTKVGMSQIFDENGDVVPVTVIKADPNQIVEIRTDKKDGYNALQLGIGEKKKNRIKKPLSGQYAKVKVETGVDVAVKQVSKEFRTNDISSYKLGDYIKADLFSVGEIVNVTGISKGKGFQGVMRRHNFAGGPKTHGSQFHRAPGSVGQCAWPSKIFKGKKMPGRMGFDQVTVKNLKIVGVDIENNRILIRGAVPGPRRGMVIIKKKQ